MVIGNHERISDLFVDIYLMSLWTVLATMSRNSNLDQLPTLVVMPLPLEVSSSFVDTRHDAPCKHMAEMKLLQDTLVASKAVPLAAASCNRD